MSFAYGLDNNRMDTELSEEWRAKWKTQITKKGKIKHGKDTEDYIFRLLFMTENCMLKNNMDRCMNIKY